MSTTTASTHLGDSARHSGTRVIEQLLRFDQPAGLLLEQVLIEMCRVGRTESGAIIDPAELMGKAQDRQQQGLPILALHPRPQQPAPPVWVIEALKLLSSIQPQEGAVVRPLPGAQQLYSETSSRHVVYLPLRCADGRWHLALFLLTTRDAALVEACRRNLEQTASLYTLFDVQKSSRQLLAGAQNLTNAVAVLSAMQQQQRFQAATMALCNEIHTNWHAQRVSIGFFRGKCIKLAAMSQTEHLKHKTPLVQAVESAMEECADQQVEIVQPANEDQMAVARQAEKLSQEHGPAWLVSVPLWVAGEVEGVLTVERAADQPMNAAEAEALRLACNLVAAPLLQLRDNDRWLGAKALTSVQRSAAMLVGSEHTWVKLAVVAGCALLAFLIFFRGPDRVTGSFLIEATQRRILTAPFDGYLETVNVEPGDITQLNQNLATLETAELRLRAGQLEADRLHYLKEAGIARRKGDIAEQQANEAEAARVQAELDLVRYQTERATISSPLLGAGVVLEGDHRREIGGAVHKGDVLFEIAPPEGLEVQVYVPEDRIGELHVGDVGELASASHPGTFLNFTIERIEPAAVVHDNKNVFRVHARLHDVPDWLRPGMEGVAKVEVGRISYLRLWTRDLTNWLRMKLWF